MEINLGFFSVDLSIIINFLTTESPFVIFLTFIALGGWLLLLKSLIGVIIHSIEHDKTHQIQHGWTWVTLAIDIPQMNVQTPKAVEQMFAHLAGSLDSANLFGKLFKGFAQRYYSFEIISIEGYIQFVVRTEESLRDLVETAVFAQYPEAEITEIEDYVTLVPDKFPNETHEIWVSDFGLAEDDAYPIRTYKEFEHNISKDTVLKDPMGTFLESFSRMGTGEQMWFQILVEPISNSWKEKAIEKIKELIGDTTGHGHGGNQLADVILKQANKSIVSFGDIIFSREASATEEHGHDEAPNKISYLTPGQKKTLEAMEDKISKIGFKVKMRGVYVARKDVFKPSRGVNALIGAINQYNVPSANSIVPKDKNKKNIKFKIPKMFKAYINRDMATGAPLSVLNIEELATIWHFPMSHVKTPLVQKAATKNVEPPSGLPTESMGSITVPDIISNKKEATEPDTFVTDSGSSYSSDQNFG